MALEHEEQVEPEVEAQVEEQPEVEAPTREPSVRDVVEASFDAVEKFEKEHVKEEPQGEETRARDPKTGKFIEKEEEKPAKPVPQPRVQAKPGTPVQAKPGVVKPAAPGDAAADRAPQSWKALAREHWAKLDTLGDSGKVIKDELVRREREVNQRLAQDAPARELATQFEQTVRPFLHLIPPGKAPLESIRGLMQTAAALQTGSPQQRAVVAANIIRGYGVDIDMLAAALDGGQNVVGPGQRPAQGGGYDPRVDQLVAELRARDAQQQQYLQQQEQQELGAIQAGYEEFAKTHEFFEDVRPDMADIIRLKAEQGVAIDDETAYHMAVSFHPELVELQRQREAVEAATNPKGSTALSRRAAVSIKPRPATRTSAVPATDLRGTVSAAMDKVMGNH
jgi:hypothetical protein